MRSYSVRLSLILLLTMLPNPAYLAAQKNYDSGASDTEIKIGNIAPYTGWGKEYAAIARAEAAYFRMINDQGGIRGRKIIFISVDNASDAEKSVALSHKLVEDDNVLLLFSSIGTESNLAIRQYMNDQKIPQLFVQTSSAAFNDPSHFSWTMGFFATYRSEGQAYAKYIQQTKPHAKIAVLYENDDIGNEYRAGVRDGLNGNSSVSIVKEVAYRTSEQTIEPQIAALKDSGADVFLNFSIGSFATQAIRTAYDLDWHPLQFIPNASLSIAAFLDPAGLEKSTGIITNARSKGWLAPRAQSDPAIKEFLDWMSRYNPEASLRDQNNMAGYERAQVLVEVLKKCGDNLTRANVMRQAANLDMELGTLRPGIRIKTSPNDYQPIKELYLMRFDGKAWVPFGGIISQ